MPGLWVPGEPQAVSLPGAGCARGSPFCTGHWCSSGWDGTGRGGTQTRGIQASGQAKNQGKTPCLLRGLCVTHGDEPEGSSFLWKWHQKVLWTPSALELSPCPSSSVLAAKEAAPMVCPKDPSLCGVPQVQRLSGANDTEGLNKARTHLQKQQSKENAKRKTNKNSHKKRRMKPMGSSQTHLLFPGKHCKQPQNQRTTLAFQPK